MTGNVGQDGKLENQWLTFSLATTKKFKTAQGDYKQDTQWHRCKMYGQRAEKIAQYILKGTKLLVEGEINYGEWVKKDGTKGYSTDIMVRDIEFLSKAQQVEKSDAPQFDQDSDLPF